VPDADRYSVVESVLRGAVYMYRRSCVLVRVIVPESDDDLSKLTQQVSNAVESIDFRLHAKFRLNDLYRKYNWYGRAPITIFKASIETK